ncbi:MAG: MerR family transcriptional regulator, partial [Lachnospiraceae bacterium]
MEQKKYLYLSGEFAKLTGVNKRTLHYYNDIGLFRPEIISKNGYHYYTCFQFPQLELILTLRKMGMSINEIQEYIARPSDESFSQMMEKKKKLIDDSIKQLLSAQAFLEQKAERLRMGMNSRHGAIELCTLPERKIVLSSPISGKYDEEDFSVAAEFSLRLKKLLH